MYLSQHDVITGAIVLATIIISLTIIELAVKNEWATKLVGRKLLHVIAICSCAFAIDRFENESLLLLLFLGFFFILLAVINKGWMQVNTYKSYGIALFPLAFAVLLFFSSVINISNIVFSVLTLAICDALAGITGEYFGKKKICFLFEQKSWIGFAAFYLSCFVLAVIFFSKFSSMGFLCCGIIALVPALTELFSYKGSDNLSVPIITAVWAYFILRLTDMEITYLFGALLIFLPLCIVAVHKKWLTISGATAAMWMALLLFVCGGVKAFIAPGLFLLSGSLLSKLNTNIKEKNGRNALQVFCNGIVGIICLILFNFSNQQVYLFAALVSFCVSMSDSVSSELGTFFKGNTVDILSLKKTPVGISGGISWQGTVAGLGGAFLLTAAALLTYQFSSIIFWQISICGFAGMLVDSILGSLLQVKYSNASGVLIEDNEQGAVKTRGFSWCNNNMVNLLSNIIITLLFILLQF
ncbi:MAG: DUF92 domain-containing protein [Ferruginibacter sp.]